jgi:hypothetical protein
LSQVDSPLTQNDPHFTKRVSGSSLQPQNNQEVAEELELSDDRQRVALELILTGATLTAVAKAVGIGRKTLYRWRTQDMVFRDELRRRRQEILDSSVDRFRDLLGKSMDLVAEHLADPFTTTALRAARTMLVMSGVSKLAIPKPPEGCAAGIIEPEPMACSAPPEPESARADGDEPACESPSAASSQGTSAVDSPGKSA